MDDKRLTDCADGGDIGHRSYEPTTFAPSYLLRTGTSGFAPGIASLPRWLNR